MQPLLRSWLKISRRWLPLLLLGGMLAMVPLAQAAKMARIQNDQAPVLQGPKKDAHEIRKLGTGTMVISSNLPIEGFYKVRLSDGVIGWIAAENVQQLDTVRVTPEEAAAAKLAGEPVGGPSPTPDGITNPDRALLVRLGGGGSIFSPTELDAIFGLKTTHLGLGITGEVGFRFTPRISALLRLEYLTESLVAVDQNSRKSYELMLTGLPVLVGPEFTLTKPKSKWSVRIGAFGGLSVLTGFSSTSLSEVAPNVTTIRGTTLALHGRILIERPVYLDWNLAADLGYRLVNTARLVPVETGNGSELFQTAGVANPIATSLTGPSFQLLVSKAF